MIEQADSGGVYRPKQTTTWDYFANGKLKTLETKNGAGAIKQSHAVSYLDVNGHYVNGNRTRDVFKLDGPKAGAPCSSSTCTTSMTYDPRDRLREEKRERGSTTKTTSYELDGAGNVTSEDHGDWKRTATFDGDQVQSQSFSGTRSGSFKFFYDSDGNLDCQTTDAGTRRRLRSPFGHDAEPNLVADAAHDSSNRLKSMRTFSGGTERDSAKYTYDAFDRPVEETENHPGFATPRATLFKYIGLSDDVSEEEQRNGSPEGSLNETKSYSYDAFGKRIGLNDKRPDGSSKDFTYGTDVHGSISLLLDETGKAQAAYGYTAYGDSDTELTEERDPWDAGGTRVLTPDNPLNPYRYSDKRLDSGSSTLDMGARRFAPGTASFLQEDVYDDALNDLGLSLDPLTQNRYSLAGGNPISFVEVDGHMLARDGGGGGSSTPKPKKKPTRRSGSVNSGRSQTTAPLSDAASGGGYRHAPNESQLVNEGRAAVRADKARDAAEARKKAEDDDGGGLGGFVHGALDVAGFVPGVGAVADVANAGLYAAEGNKGEAAFALAAAVPIAGDAAKGAKLAYKGAKAADDAGGAAQKFHRLESPTQTPATARQQVASQEIWGKTPRGGIHPTVQAYRGPLPRGARGVEFETDVPTNNPHGPPGWSVGGGGARPGLREEDGFAKLCVRVTKNTQC